MKELITCDEAMVEALQARLKQATTIAEFQRIQCVLMRVTLDCTASEIAQVLGWAGLGDGDGAHHALALGEGRGKPL